MNVAICDDEKVWQDEIKQYIYEYGKSRKVEMFVQCFSDGQTCINETSGKYDIIFMDFQMAAVNGIETAEKIRQTNSDSAIIFISAYPQIAMDAFEVKTFRFLAKPINVDKLFKAIDDYRKEVAEEHRFLIFKTHDRTIRIKISDIIWAEARKNHTLIHTLKEDVEVLINLKAVERKLPQDKFFRCHNAYITSFGHIKHHNNTEIHYNDDSISYISRHRIAKFRSALVEYIENNKSGEAV